jgi:hypothetical protein
MKKKLRGAKLYELRVILKKLVNSKIVKALSNDCKNMQNVMNADKDFEVFGLN